MKGEARRGTVDEWEAMEAEALPKFLLMLTEEGGADQTSRRGFKQVTNT